MDLARVKLQLDVTRDDQDPLLQGYIDAARSHVEMHCDRTIVAGVPADESEMAETPDVEQAMLMLIAHWYEHREAVTDGSVSETPLGVERLLWYRKRF